MIGVAVLGSTGSIGESTLDVLGRHPDKFKLVALGANRNVAKLAAQVLRWRPAYAVLADEIRQIPLPACRLQIHRTGLRTGRSGRRSR